MDPNYLRRKARELLHIAQRVDEPSIAAELNALARDLSGWANEIDGHAARGPNGPTVRD